MSNKHSEQLLQELYEQDKQGSVLPSSNKQNILNYAKQRQGSAWRLATWRVATALLVVVVGVAHWLKPASSNVYYNVSTSSVGGAEQTFYHDIVYKQTKKKVSIEKSKPTANDAYKTYLASLDNLKNRQQFLGRVTRVNNETVIQVCQLGFIQLSSELLAQISSDPLQIGQPVQLVANDNGIITQITGVEKGEFCPSEYTEIS